MQRWMAKVLALSGTFVLPLICTLLPLKVHDYFVKKGKTGKMVLSWLMCFGGGVFFATYILHMGPEVRLILGEALIDPYEITYPLSELFIGLGFFLVLFIEKTAMKIHRRRSLQKKQKCADCPFVDTLNGDVKFLKENRAKDMLDIEDLGGVAKLNPCSCKDGALDMQTDCSNDGGDKKETAGNMEDKGHGIENYVDEFDLTQSSSRSLVLAIALSLHRIFEGMSIGLKHTTKGVASLFLAVICHETVIGFSLGLQFVRNKFSTQRTVLFTLLCSVIMPLGVAIGTVIVEVGHDSHGLDIINGVLQAISSGTFIYVTFFEILQDEITHHDTSLGKPIFLAIGFAVMAGLSAIPEPPEQLAEIIGTTNGFDMTTAP